MFDHGGRSAVQGGRLLTNGRRKICSAKFVSLRSRFREDRYCSAGTFLWRQGLQYFVRFPARALNRHNLRPAEFHLDRRAKPSLGDSRVLAQSILPDSSALSSRFRRGDKMLYLRQAGKWLPLPVFVLI